MHRTISIHQPQYLPWPGYFDRLRKSTIHVVLDTVQHEPHSFENRNRVLTGPNKASWLTVPLKHPVQVPIREVQVDNSQNWRRKHWKAIEQTYHKSPYWKHDSDWLYNTYLQDWTHLLPLCEHITAWLRELSDVHCTWLYASQLGVTGTKSSLVLNICRELGADEYLSGPLGRGYLDERAFKEAGISLTYHDYQQEPYKQIYDGWVPNLSAIDYVFRGGEA